MNLHVLNSTEIIIYFFVDLHIVITDRREKSNMKIVRKFLCLIIVCMATLFSCSCYKEPSVPGDGVWICDDLSVVIDFTLWQQGEGNRCSIRFINDDKVLYEPVYTHVHINSNYMVIEPINVNSDMVYAQGECDYSDEVFKIHDYDSGKVYTFVRTP